MDPVETITVEETTVGCDGGTLGHPLVYLNLGSDGDRRDYRVDFSRIRKYLNFTPAWTVEMGIQQVIDAIESGKVTDYTDPIYSNVKTLNMELVPPVIDLRGEETADVHLHYMVRRGSGGPWTASLMDNDSPTPEAVEKKAG